MSTSAPSPATAATARSAIRACSCASSTHEVMCPYCSRLYVLNAGPATARTLNAPRRPQSAGRPPHLILIDGSGFIFRAFHALPPMTRPDGTPVNAVFGFTNMLAKLLKDHVGTHIAVIFDAGRLTFRNRHLRRLQGAPPASRPTELIPQFALVREATEAFGVPAIELADWEADDLIASYARAAVEAGGAGHHRLLRQGPDAADPARRGDARPDQAEADRPGRGDGEIRRRRRTSWSRCRR